MFCHEYFIVKQVNHLFFVLIYTCKIKMHILDKKKSAEGIKKFFLSTFHTENN